MPEREGRSYQGCPEIFCDDLRTSMISRRNSTSKAHLKKWVEPTHWEQTEFTIRILSVQMKNRIMGNME